MRSARTWWNGSPTPMYPGRKTPFPACSATWWPAGSASSTTWAAPTALWMRPAPVPSAPCTWPAWSLPPANPTWWSPAASIPSTTSSCTCASARLPHCRPAATQNRSTPRRTAPSWAKAWASWSSRDWRTPSGTETRYMPWSEVSAPPVTARAMRSMPPARADKKRRCSMPTAKPGSHRTASA